jgi:hypothetical protein
MLELNKGKELVQRLLKRIKDLETARDQRESVWNAIMNAIDPFWIETKHRYEQYGNKGFKYSNGRFETNYKGAFGSLIERATLTLTAQMLDPSISWLGLKLHNYKDAENPYLKEYIKDLSEWVYGITNDPDSGFYTCFPEIVGNAYKLGIGSRYCSYSDDETAILPAYGYQTGLNFESVDPRFFVFDRDGRGKLNFYARKLVLSLEDAIGLWGEGAGEIAHPNGVDYRNVNTYEEIRKYYHVVIPNPKIKKGSINYWICRIRCGRFCRKARANMEEARRIIWRRAYWRGRITRKRR